MRSEDKTIILAIALLFAIFGAALFFDKANRELEFEELKVRIEAGVAECPHCGKQYNENKEVGDEAVLPQAIP